MKRTIICLAAKRSGTTAIHQIFVNHPDTAICHPNQKIQNWEPNFWNYAAAALDNDPQQLELKNRENGLTPQQQFAERMAIMAADISVCFPLSEARIFELWDALLDKYGPIVFDKSPKYLSSARALALLQQYMAQGNDVRIFGLIRNPRDAIASQYELWHRVVPAATPEYRDTVWTEYYQTFEQLQAVLGKEKCPLIRYEDLAADPEHWVSFIFEHCGLAHVPETYQHIRPVSVGRYYQTQNPSLVSWRGSQALKDLAARYNYEVEKPPKRRHFGTTKNKSIAAAKAVARRFRGLAKFAVEPLLGRLPTAQLEALILQLVTKRLKSLPPQEALRFLFRLDAAFYPLQGQSATRYNGGLHPKHRFLRYHDFFVNRIHTGEKVLDLGCGIGAVAYDVAEKAGAQVLAIDLNAANIEVGLKRYAHPNITYQVGDILQDVPGQSFDVVILSNVLEHLPGRSNFLHQVQIAAQPSRFLIRVPLFERDWRVPLKREIGVEWRLDPTHETEYTLETFTAEMAAAGLSVCYQEVRWGEIWAEVRPHDHA